MKDRKPCKECPWTRSDGHSLKFRGYAEKMEEIGSKGHACHMLTSDVWNPTDKNQCTGRKLCGKK